MKADTIHSGGSSTQPGCHCPSCSMNSVHDRMTAHAHAQSNHLINSEAMMCRFVVGRNEWAVAPADESALECAGIVHVTRHTSHVTRHTSHVTRHTSHVTRHTSHVTLSRRYNSESRLDPSCGAMVQGDGASESLLSPQQQQQQQRRHLASHRWRRQRPQRETNLQTFRTVKNCDNDR
jgi:hypothetical protein